MAGKQLLPQKQCSHDKKEKKRNERKIYQEQQLRNVLRDGCRTSLMLINVVAAYMEHTTKCGILYIIWL